MTSIFGMLGLELSAPDHTTLSRRGQHLDLPLRRAPAGAGLHLIVASTGHLGRLERIDGATFSAEDADGPLHTLFRFLGFARGAAANLPIRWGVNPSGDTIWEEWRSPVVDQWKTPQNWFDENHGTLLREIFPAFVRAYEDPNLNELPWCTTRDLGQ